MSESRSGGGISLPAAPSQTPGLPSNFHPVAFEKFDGLNTKTARAALQDGEMAWSDGFYPLAPSTLRTLYGIGDPIFSAPATILTRWFGFGNISDTFYCFALLSDGRVDSVNVDNNAFLNVLPPGSIGNPRSVFGFSQWGSQFVIFATDQANGYWLWDGTNTFGAGTVGPFVDLTNSGSMYSSLPTIGIQTTGSGSGTTFLATLDGDAVSLVKVTNPGSGFVKDDVAIINFTGGGSDDQATATVSLSAGGGVTGVVVTNPGMGYTFKAVLSFLGGGGSGAAGILNIQNGGIQSITMLNPGHGYTSPPAPLVTDPGYMTIPGGSGASGYVTIGANGVDTISVATGGSGYTSVPQVNIVGDGSGAEATATISGGVVTAITVTNPGQGYTKALAQIVGGNNAANANITLMPFGISGTTVEVYQQRVWISNGAAIADQPPKGRTLFSAPENPIDFGNGGGAFPATDSFVRVGYHGLKQSNGFLYLIGDSSTNYISGVSTSSAPATSTTPAGSPITTFGNQNVDPQIGSPWPSSVQVFSRNIVFANAVGVFVSYGGAVTKVSEALDGFYASNPTELNASLADFSSAVANVFGVPVYILLLPVVDSFTGQQTNKLLMWNGRKWCTSQQDVPLTYIATQERGSQLTAWGSDGMSIFPILTKPSTGFQKVARSKLFSSPAYWTTKTATRVHVVAKNLHTPVPTMTVTLDTEKGPGSGNAVATVPMVSNPEIDVLGPYPVGQAGRMIGLTVTTSAADMEIISVGVTEQVFETNI